MTNVESSVRSTYPIFKHYDGSGIQQKVDEFGKGEKGLFWFIKLGFMIAVAYAIFVYVLPPVFQAVGKISAIAATGVFCVAFIMAIPAILRGLRAFTRFLHRAVIKYDPFGALREKLDAMKQNQRVVRSATGSIQGIQSNAEAQSIQNEKDAKILQSKITRLNEIAKALRTQMDDMVKSQGVVAKESDEYVNAKIDFDKAVSDSVRIGFQLNQCKDFVSKYGSRASIMKKTVQKLKMVDASLDIKILDFDATITMLEADFKFAAETKDATDQAKRALGIEKDEEVKFTLDFVNSTIASDIAITSGNLKDIDSLTKNFAMDSDEMYNNLELLANNINSGTDIIPSAKQYRNPDYKLTSDDKTKAGGFENIF
jgi:hypothetical protein